MHAMYPSAIAKVLLKNKASLANTLKTGYSSVLVKAKGVL